MSTTCICILNYNNGLKTTRCISGILGQTLQDYRMIIIDNDSTDDSLDVIQEFLGKEQVPFRFANPGDELTKKQPDQGEVLIVKSGRNGGYSYGNNTGIRLAKSLMMFSYLLIINNDVVLKENFLEETVKRYEQLRDSNGTAKIALGATELGEDGKVHHKGFHYLHLLSGITFASPFFPSFKYIVGSCLFTTIDAPLMDESFFLYFDDTQYSKILRRNAYILEDSPRSLFVHEVGGTSNKDLQGQIFKSLRRFYLLNYPFLLLLVVPWRLLLVICLRIKKKK
ncbi:MAG: glycosyltransferase family 2 protein [Bacteroidetes bacterium]|nr:glycosyltransferase family 2 protein [Bacteroidota bacterium]